MNGQAVPREQHLLSVEVQKSVNRVSSARLAYLDGAASTGDFPLASAPTFAPGAEIEILAGDAAARTRIFQGVVVRQAIKVRPRSAPQLVVECRHKAFRLTARRRSACYLGQTDAEVMGALLHDAGLDADVERTSVRHTQLVQYRSTDWDFLVGRAEANGMLVTTSGPDVKVKAPRHRAAAVLSLQFGATVLELDAELDARQQWSGVKAMTWDPAQQALVTCAATDPAAAVAGSPSAADLAGVAGAGDRLLPHAALAEPEAQAWADATWLRSQLSKVSGRVKVEGLATLEPGQVVTLGGVGSRFGGDVLVTGVRHLSDLVQGWKTHIQFGSVDGRLGGEPTATEATVGGLQIGTVTSNEDPDGEARVKVRLPLVDATGDGVWARVASLDAGQDRGFCFRPELGDEVVVGFLDEDPRGPVILGMLHSSARPPPLQGSNDNHQKVYRSRAGLRLHFDDRQKEVRLETPAGNAITLSEDARGIRISDQNGNSIVLDPDGVRIESTAAVRVKAATELGLESGTSLGAKAGAGLALSGASGAELSSASVTQVKGSLVKLN